MAKGVDRKGFYPGKAVQDLLGGNGRAKKIAYHSEHISKQQRRRQKRAILYEFKEQSGWGIERRDRKWPRLFMMVVLECHLRHMHMPPSSLIPASSKRHETKVCVQFEQCEKNNRGNFLIFRCASPAWIHISSTVEEEKGFSEHVQIKSGKSTRKSSLDEAYSRRRCPENARKIEHNESVFPSTRNKRIFVHF